MQGTRSCIIYLMYLLAISCGEQQSNNTDSITDSTSMRLQTNATPPVENIKRPALSTIINSKFPLEKLFGIWAADTTAPHASFQLNDKSFYVVDYDGDGDMPYVLNQDTLIIYFEDYVVKGIIKKANNDNLIISWDNRDENINYIRWKK